VTAGRPARPGERCKCGRPAVAVFLAEHGDVPWCGIPDADVPATGNGRPERSPADHILEELVHALGRIAVLLSDASAVWYSDREKAKQLVDQALVVANREGR